MSDIKYTAEGQCVQLLAKLSTGKYLVAGQISTGCDDDETWFDTDHPAVVDRVFDEAPVAVHEKRVAELLAEVESFNQDCWPCIMIGSSGEYRDVGSAIWWTRMADVMLVACHQEGDLQGMPRRNYHGARMLDPDIFSHVPLHSGDSTNVARNSGIDKAWNGPYAPPSVASRAMVMMARIEHHASARRW
jgi:hypothetical protein